MSATKQSKTDRVRSEIDRLDAENKKDQEIRRKRSADLLHLRNELALNTACLFIVVSRKDVNHPGGTCWICGASPEMKTQIGGCEITFDSISGNARITLRGDYFKMTLKLRSGESAKFDVEDHSYGEQIKSNYWFGAFFLFPDAQRVYEELHSTGCLPMYF